MIDELIAVVQFIGRSIGALFDALDVLNIVYSLGQFVLWCIQNVMEFVRDLIVRRS